MRSPACLLAAALLAPTLSQAEVVYTSPTWQEMYAGSQLATPTYAEAPRVPNGNNPQDYLVAQFTGWNSMPWGINSITLDGISVMNPMYTPVASDFSITIRNNSVSQNWGLSSITAVGTSVGPVVSVGNGITIFSITFSNIANYELYAPGFYSIGPGENYIDLIPSATSTSPFFSAQEVQYNGFFKLPDEVTQNYNATINGTNGWFAQQMGLALTIDAFPTFITPPVPEPSTYGLALGGLALVGALIRRRKSSK